MFQLSHEVQAKLSQAVADLKLLHQEEPQDIPAQLAVEFDGLPIYADLGGSVLLFSTGKLMMAEHDVGGLKPIEHPWDTISLAVGVRKFPWLQPFLPKRAATDTDCSACDGIGQVPLGTTSFNCGTCFGLGWINASQ